tara:strand:- start:1319 stop:2416 length:1098 start_codon:yes stop_codon:yes gene_type:complete
MDDCRLPLGIHFGLDEEKYHADPALGSTSIVKLATAPVLFQYERMRPEERVQTEAMTFGKAFHCRLLEGKEAFEERYAEPPKPSDYKGALTTTDSVKDFLRQHGQKLTGNKPDLIARAKEIDDCPPIFDEILASWHEEHPDYEMLTPKQVKQVEDAIELMERDPILRAVMTAGSLSGGAPEMSVIYEQDGIRRKCRFDYPLAPTATRPNALIVDAKAFSTFKGATDEDAAIRKIYDMFYDIQGKYYLQGRIAARKLFRQGKIFGDGPSPDFLEHFLFAEQVDWVWVMIRRDKGLVPVVISVAGDDEMLNDMEPVIQHALETYSFYMSEFGPDQLWSPPPRKPLRLNKSFLPTYNRGILHEQPANR